MTATAYLKSIACLPLLLLIASCSNSSNSLDEPNTSAKSNMQSDEPTPVLRIAAAANLAGVLPSIIDEYNKEHSAKAASVQDSQSNIEVTYASSGKLYAQINSGAPYDIFLSADQSYPAKYIQQHPPQDNSNVPFTYAQGQLAFYSSKHPLHNEQNADESTLSQTQLSQLLANESKSTPTLKITIANPELAPYGASAKAFLQQQGLYDTLSANKHIIQAENISQAFQYTHTASTDYGFVALSQLISAKVKPSQYLRLAPNSYPAILQDGIIISQHPKAGEFSQYLQSAPAQQLFSDAGYLPIKKDAAQ